MAGPSREEAVGIAAIGITVAVFAWYRADVTGVRRVADAAIGLLVSVGVATATFHVLGRWDPFWYRS